jgi:hypothetical protein
MSFGDDYIPYSDDQVAVHMTSEFDTEPWPGLYDTTRNDIFKMVSSPCLSCDKPFKGMPKQMQFGPPFRPPCESSMSAKYNVISEVKAQYPEDGVQTLKSETFYNKPCNCGCNSSKENYQTFGGDHSYDRPYVSACGRQPGCSCLGLVGCRRLPEAAQSGVYPGINYNIEGFAGQQPPMMKMIFLFLIIIIVYISYMRGEMAGRESRNISGNTSGTTSQQ